MGTDIHGHQEIKIDGIWHHYAPLAINRNYVLFEKLAGVRGDVHEAIRPTRGLPNLLTITPLTLIDISRWNTSGHSWSWFGLPEIRQLYHWYKSQGKHLEEEWGWLYGNGWITNPLYDDGIIQDVRWIFWFDS